MSTKPSIADDFFERRRSSKSGRFWEYVEVTIGSLMGKERLYDPESREEARVFKTIFHRCVPLLMISYIVAHIDPVRIGMAKLPLWFSTPIFWTIPPSFLRGSAAAGGVALISSGSALGGFISPIIIGFVSKATGSVLLGLAAVGAMLVVAATIFVASNLLDRGPANSSQQIKSMSK